MIKKMNTYQTLTLMVMVAGLIAATFEHAFAEAGEYPYFCLLHPNMVGAVGVS